jgi:hypothetical protein
VADETRKQTDVEDPVAGGASAEGDGPAATETRVQKPVTPARAKADAAAAKAKGAGGAPAKTELIRVGDRGSGDTSRSSPRMRFDLLQIAAWVIGLALIVGGLVAIARTGFDDLGLFEPVVEVNGQPATPLYALLWLLIGAALLASATGAVNEQRLRIAGVLLVVVGLVFLIEPDAFEEFLGVTTESGRPMVLAGALLIATSFVPPLSIRRPGIADPGR